MPRWNTYDERTRYQAKPLPDPAPTVVDRYGLTATCLDCGGTLGHVTGSRGASDLGIAADVRAAVECLACGTQYVITAVMVRTGRRHGGARLTPDRPTVGPPHVR